MHRLGMSAALVMTVGMVMTACQNKNGGPTGGVQNPMAPLVVGSQTPTRTSTPRCGFTVVNVSPFNLQTSPTPAITVVYIPVATPTGTTIWNHPVPSVTPNTTAVPYGGDVRVIRTLADWQDHYGDQTPPVDLSTQMILQTYVENDCFGNSSFQQVCEDSDQVTVTLFQSSENYGCNLHAYMWISAAVDRTDKPVVWQVVSP